MKQTSRLDLELVSRGLADTRARAQALVLAGVVSVNGRQASKAGLPVGEGDVLEIAENPNPYVSRGGLKLRRALDVFGLDPSGAPALDVGASTGGFTDCLLQAGATRVYAVDTGYGQLAWSLREDPRVISMEKTNFRYLAPEAIPEKLPFAAMDCSFISAHRLAGKLVEFLAADAAAVILVKPQFESAAKDAPKGVVKSAAVHERVLLESVRNTQEAGLALVGLDHSPIKGPKGNIEFLAYYRYGREAKTDLESTVSSAVRLAHEELSK